MIDVLATQPHYRDHLQPVWDALPVQARGSFIGRGESRTSDAVLIAGYPDLGRARRLGYQRFALLEHGIGQTYGKANPSYPGGRHRDPVSLFLSPNEHAAGKDRAAYPAARVEVIGCPKLDALPRREPDGLTTVALSFHWDCQVAPETRSAFPHYRDKLADLASRFHVIGHSHPRGASLMQRVYAKLGIEFVADFEDVCRRADLFIADNTSALYEFASTGRPVVVLNAPWYRKDVSFGLRFWDAAKVGLNVFCPCDLLAMTAEALKDDAQARADREAALDIAYAYRTGAASRASAALVQWALGRQVPDAVLDERFGASSDPGDVRVSRAERGLRGSAHLPAGQHIQQEVDLPLARRAIHASEYAA